MSGAAAAPARLKPTELMRACGSKTGAWEPESADQWRWSMRNGTAEERALAWIRLKSVANKSPWCVDETGRQLRIESLAADVGWQLHTAKNVCTSLVNQGRIRLNNGRIFYRADVPEKGEDGRRSVLFTKDFPAYLVDSIRGLDLEKKALLEAAWARLEAWRRELEAEALAAARAIVEQAERTTLAAFGVEKKYLEKRREPKLQLELKLGEAVPDFVQKDSVQDLHKPQNGLVQSGASLLPSDSDSERSRSVGRVSPITEQAPAPVPEAPDDRPTDSQLAAVIMEEIPNGDTPGPKLLAGVRTGLVDATVDEFRFALRLVKGELVRKRKAVSQGIAIQAAARAACIHRHQQDRDRRKGDDPDEMRRAQARIDAQLADARAVLANPASTKSEREDAREVLRIFG